MTTTTESGRIVGERYELGELLGAGAMGQVFAARDLVLGIDVALKMMHEALIDCEEQVALMALEATNSSRVVSPHVIKVLAASRTEEGAPYIVYERLVGETLGERLLREGGLSLVDTVEVVTQTSHALGRAHRSGVLHRDVKPDNIFLTKDADGRLLVKLFDFGIAAMADPHGSYAGSPPAGTPEYMAPEVLLGTHDLDARSDLYALGVVAFECLTGDCPFPGDLQGVLDQLVSGIGSAFTEHRPDLRGAVDAWMSRALHADPYWRFSSARELRDALLIATRPVAPLRLSRAA